MSECSARMSGMAGVCAARSTTNLSGCLTPWPLEAPVPIWCSPVVHVQARPDEARPSGRALFEEEAYP